MAVTPLPGFPGFAVEYNPADNPYFKSIMVENLAKLKTVALGKELLKLIGDAKPGSRGTFPNGINVICRPFKARYIQVGFKPAYAPGETGGTRSAMAPSAHPAHNVAGSNFHCYGSSLNMAVDQTETAVGKRGTVCYMDFSNAQIIASGGEKAYPHIVLAHELIHSYHCLYAIHADSEEERKTTGIGAYANERMSENGFRKAFNLPLRAAYG